MEMLNWSEKKLGGRQSIPAAPEQKKDHLAEWQQQLLAKLSDLHINGTEDDEREFEWFKRGALAEIDPKAGEILSQLDKHHHHTLKHNVMVAHDAAYIAREMRMDETTVADIQMASMLHDVGKLQIHQDILDLGGEDTLRMIMQFNRGTINAPANINTITVREVMRYQAEISGRSDAYADEFLQWFSDRGVDQFLDQSIRTYLNHHQAATKTLLSACGIDRQVVDIAAGHHSKYYSPQERSDLPKEARVVEMADKFNALIQSEGIRHYMGELDKRTRTEALNIIAKELREEFEQEGDEQVRIFAKQALAVLLKKHLKEEVSQQVLPTVSGVVQYLRQLVREEASKRKQAVEQIKPDANKLLMLIPLITSLSREFENILEEDVLGQLNESEQLLRGMLLAVVNE